MKNTYKNCPCGNHCPIHFRMTRRDPKDPTKVHRARKGHPFPIPECSLKH